MDFLNKVKVFFKKQKLQKEPEQVDIRLSSIPDWLYKITLSDPKDLKLKVEDYMNSIRTFGEKLHGRVLDFKKKQFLADSVSQYKKNIIFKKKEEYVERIEELTVAAYDFNETELDAQKSGLESLYRSFRDFNVKRKNYEKALNEFFSDDVEKIGKAYERTLEELSYFQRAFKSENNDKVNGIVDMVHKVRDSLLEREKIQKEIKSINQDITATKNNILKLKKKSTEFKKGQRFKDVLRDRPEIVEIVKNKDRALKELKSMIGKIALPKKDIVFSYRDDFESALSADDDLALLEVISKNDMQEDVDVVSWLKENFSKKRREVLAINEDLRKACRGIRGFVVLSEIEDIEERVKYFGERLKTHLDRKKQAIDKINSLEIEENKKKVYKDILILTGYDVNIIYDE